MRQDFHTLMTKSRRGCGPTGVGWPGAKNDISWGRSSSMNLPTYQKDTQQTVVDWRTEALSGSEARPTSYGHVVTESWCSGCVSDMPTTKFYRAGGPRPTNIAIESGYRLPTMGCQLVASCGQFVCCLCSVIATGDKVGYTSSFQRSNGISKRGYPQGQNRLLKKNLIHHPIRKQSALTPGR